MSMFSLIAASTISECFKRKPTRWHPSKVIRACLVKLRRLLRLVLLSIGLSTRWRWYQTWLVVCPYEVVWRDLCDYTLEARFLSLGFGVYGLSSILCERLCSERVAEFVLTLLWCGKRPGNAAACPKPSEALWLFRAGVLGLRERVEGMMLFLLCVNWTF